MHYFSLAKGSCAHIIDSVLGIGYSPPGKGLTMDHGQLILNALSSVGTHDGLEQILEHTIELAAGAILFAIIVRLGNTIYNIARRIIGASIDNVAQMRSSWAKRRVRYILDVYSHDLRLRNNTIELVSWAS